jgi:hypothetical protein
MDSTADRELRQVAMLDTSAVVWSERCAVAVNCTVCPGATDPGPPISMRVVKTGGAPDDVGRKLGRVGVLLHAMTSKADATRVAKPKHRIVRMAVLPRALPDAERDLVTPYISY